MSINVLNITYIVYLNKYYSNILLNNYYMQTKK